jgi:hydrogenase maturation protease
MLMKLPLVIGYGNTLRQDDGLGWRAAELLERTMPRGLARILECRQLTPELSAEFDGAPVVIFLDAALDTEPGTVVSKRVSSEKQMVWSHDLSPGQLAGLTEALTGATPAVFQITGGVRRTGFGEDLAPEGEESAKRMAKAAIELLQEYTGSTASGGPSESASRPAAQ